MVDQRPIAAVPIRGPKQHGLLRMRTRLLVAIGLAAAFVASGASGANTGDRPALQRLGDDVYAGGRTVVVQEAVPGDAVAAGGEVTMSGRIGGDALVAGGSVSIDASVAENLYAAGGEVRVAGPVGAGARIAGGRVVITQDADIGGAVTVAGGSVTLDGHLRGYALVTAGRTEVNGRIDGDLRVVGRELALGPQAVVQGRLDYRGTQPLRMAEGARVEGGIAEASKDPDAGVASGMPRGVLVVLVASAILSAAVLLAIAPRASRRVTQALRSRPIVSPLLGVVLLAGLPVAALLLLVTVVGIPLGIVAIAALLALLPLGLLAAAAALGDAVVERRTPAGTWKRIFATALALLLLFALTRVPYVGWLVWPLALLSGIGAIGFATFGARRTPALQAAPDTQAAQAT